MLGFPRKYVLIETFKAKDSYLSIVSVSKDIVEVKSSAVL